MGKLLTAITGVVLSAATWILLFVILGLGLGTSFIAAGVVLAAGVIGAAMISARERGVILDAPVTSIGLVAGIATFAVLEVVLSVPMWIGVVSALGTIGLYDLTRAFLFPLQPVRRTESLVYRRTRGRGAHNGHGRYDREPAGAH